MCLGLTQKPPKGRIPYIPMRGSTVHRIIIYFYATKVSLNEEHLFLYHDLRSSRNDL